MILNKMQEFEENEVQEVYTDCIRTAKQTLVENEHEWRQQFLHNFREAMKNALILQKKRLSGCCLKGAKFGKSSFYLVRFENCDMADTDLTDCDAENYCVANS